MSEYLSKKAVLEWLESEMSINKHPDDIDIHWTLNRVSKKILSGAFDVPDGEVQRLKVALAKAKGWIKYLEYIGQNIEPEMEKKAFDEIDEILSGAREGEGR